MASLLKQVEEKFYRRLRREPPQGKLHRITFWLVVVYLLLGVGRLAPGGFGDICSGLSVLVVLAIIPFALVLLWRWVFSRLLWKVRNRLIVTYLFLGLAPVVLGLTLALIAAYMFSGQFAAFAALSEIDKELERLTAENRAYALHLAHVLQHDAGSAAAKTIELPEAEMGDQRASARASGLQLAAFEDGHPLLINGKSPVAAPGTGTEAHAPTTLPAWVPDGYRGVVFADGLLYLRAVSMERVGAHTVVLVSSVPLAQPNVDQIASGLGAVTIFPTFDETETATGSQNNINVDLGRPSDAPIIEVNKKDLRTLQQSSGTIHGGQLPNALHFYDLKVEFGAPLQTKDWETGKPHTAAMQVESRPSLLYQRLFITSLQIEVIIQDLLIIIAIFFLVLELIAFLMGMRLNQTITRSVSDLYHATQEIDRGNLAHRIVVRRNDQLAALSRSFNGMAESLERLIVEQREKQRLENELSIAQEVQANLFPLASVSLPMLELHGVCRPARTVSGDYYDFLLFGETGMGLALGDISGKGISAALLMATLHSAVRAYRFAGERVDGVLAASPALLGAHGSDPEDCGELFEEPGRILALLNRHLYRSTQPEKYATLFLGHYDGLTNRLIYSNGGHLPPLVLRGDDSITRLDCGGTVVGLLDNMSYEQGTVTLKSGDILVAYSDGVTEPENEFGDFGEERMMEIVRHHRHKPLPAISDHVLQALRSWIGDQEQPDDITLVLARQL